VGQQLLTAGATEDDPGTLQSGPGRIAKCGCTETQADKNRDLRGEFCKKQFLSPHPAAALPNRPGRSIPVYINAKGVI